MHIVGIEKSAVMKVPHPVSFIPPQFHAEDLCIEGLTETISGSLHVVHSR